MTPEALTAYIVGCLRVSADIHVTEAERLLAEHDAHRRTQVLAEQRPEDCETLAEAADAYRWLRPVIVDTMVDSDRWDGDESEEFHLGRYVQWLAAGRAQVRAEALTDVADRFEGYGGRLLTGEQVAALIRGGKDTGGTPAGESTQPAPDFFQPDRTYAHANYRFQCLYHVTHPVTGEVQAWGWFGKATAEGRRHMSFGRGQWEARAWDDITDGRVQCDHGRYLPHSCPSCQIGTRT